MWPIALLAALLLASSNTKITTEYTPDDAYFYLVVARNAARGLTSTFSGLDPTNGYHPLWAWVLQPLFYVVSDQALAVRLVCLAQMGLYAGCVVLLVKFLPHERRAERALVGVAFSFLAAYASWYGLEAGLACFLFLVTLRRAHAYVAGASDTKRALILGVCSGLTVLSRLDAALLLAPALLYVAWVDHRRNAPPWRALAPAVVGAACVLPYLISNLVHYGHLMPISGFIKSSFPHFNPVNYPLLSRRWARLAVPLIIALAAQLVGHRFAAKLSTDRRRVLHLNSTLALGLALFYVYEIFFQFDADWALFSWHFSVATAAACGMLATTLGIVRHRLFVNAAYIGLTMAVVAMVALRFWPTRRGDGGLIDVLNAAHWVAKNVPAGTRIATTDSGIIAFFGDRPTINLDGLINNFEYQDVVRDRKLPTYLTEHGVKHVIITGRGFYEYEGGCYCTPVEHRHKKDVETWLCFDEGDLVYRTPGYPKKPKNGRTGVFRWPPAHLREGDPLPKRDRRACAVRRW